VFHVELRQFPNVTRAFNLTRAELLTRIVRPWVAGAQVEWGERQWDPGKARIAIYEGRTLGPEEIGLGRGWAQATRAGTEVTAQVLDEARVPPALESFKTELAEACEEGPVPLSGALALAGARHPQARASERLALAEDAVWQLLHEERVELGRGGEPLGREEWGPALLSWQAWAGAELALRAR
jgi:hypothetical protein